MKIMRSADQFIHTGLTNADVVHQFAHELLEKWEKFARKLDQRRKLLSVVVSFYKQAETATEKLGQLEREIHIEDEKIKNVQNNDIETSQIELKIEPSNNLAQLHTNFSNQIAEITAPCLRDGKMLLEKLNKDDFEGQHIIRRVYEFNEQVKDLKSKLV